MFGAHEPIRRGMEMKIAGAVSALREEMGLDGEVGANGMIWGEDRIGDQSSWAARAISIWTF